MQNQIEAGKVNGAEFGRSSIAVVTRMLCLLHMYFKIAFSSFHPPKVFFTFLLTLPRIPSFFNTCTGASTRFIFLRHLSPTDTPVSTTLLHTEN